MQHERIPLPSVLNNYLIPGLSLLRLQWLAKVSQELGEEVNS